VIGVVAPELKRGAGGFVANEKLSNQPLGLDHFYEEKAAAGNT
jgi:hypothetical protein